MVNLCNLWVELKYILLQKNKKSYNLQFLKFDRQKNKTLALLIFKTKRRNNIYLIKFFLLWL